MNTDIGILYYICMYWYIFQLPSSVLYTIHDIVSIECIFIIIYLDFCIIIRYLNLAKLDWQNALGHYTYILTIVLTEIK